MRVTPISEKEAAESGLRKRGLYDFEVLEAKERTSKAGNDMIETNVKLYDSEGHNFRLFDYLVSSEGMAYKVRHFASATGLLPAYEKGDLIADDCVGKTGRCQIGIQPAKDGYPAKNIIQDYVPMKAGAPLIASMSAKDVAKELDDDIPF